MITCSPSSDRIFRLPWSVVNIIFTLFIMGFTNSPVLSESVVSMQDQRDYSQELEEEFELQRL